MVKFNIRQLLYYICSCFIFLYYIFKYTYFNLDIDILMYISLAVFIVLLFSERVTRRQMIIFVSVLCLGMYVLAMTGEASLLISCAMILGAKSVDLKKVFGIWLGVLIIGIFTINSSAFIINKSDMLGRLAYRGTNQVYRYSMGFNHPNRYALALYLVAQVFILSRGKDCKWYHWMIFLMINVYSFIMTNSRTAFLVSILAVLIRLLLSTNKGNRAIQIAFPLAFPILTVICYWISKYGILGKNALITLIDAALQSRFTWGFYALSRSDISLFPKQVSLGGLTLDCGYINLLLKMGIVLTALYAVLYYVFWKKNYVKLSKEVITFFVVAFCYALTEDISLILCYNPVLVFFSMCVQNEPDEYISSMSHVVEKGSINTGKRRLNKV